MQYAQLDACEFIQEKMDLKTGKTGQGSGWDWLRVLVLENRAEHTALSQALSFLSPRVQVGDVLRAREAPELSQSLPAEGLAANRAELGLPCCSCLSWQTIPCQPGRIWICCF